MELGMREWFLVVGGLMIFGVLAHGAWLLIRSRRDALGVRYEREIPDIDVDDIDLLRGELPTGGARVVTAAAARAEQADQAAELDGPDAAEPPAEAESAGVEFAEQVPVLLDPIDQDLADEDDAAAPAEERAEAPIDAAPEASGSDSEPEDDAAPETEPSAVPEAEVSDDVAPVAVAQTEAEGSDIAHDMEQTPLFAGEPIVTRDEAADGRRRRGSRRGRRRDAETEAESESDDRVEATPPSQSSAPTGPPEDVIVINVLCRGGAIADGPALLEAITEHGMRFGDMNIFHRHSPTDRSRIDFSLAAAVEPGTFDLGAVEKLETPGVTMFMQLPGPANALEAFEDMVSIARGIASRVGADLRDEQHSVMTAQTIEHCRQRIRDFTRRQMSRRA